jgi:nucleotide-binding universal stress UspA family protein
MWIQRNNFIKSPLTPSRKHSGLKRGFISHFGKGPVRPDLTGGGLRGILILNKKDKNRGTTMFKKILIANDGSDGAKHALQVAIDLAKKYNAELHSISVEEGVPHYAATIGEVEEFKKEANGYFQKINDEAKEEVKKAGIDLHIKVQAGHEVETIVNYAKKENFDLLVIGFMGHSKIFGRVWGSTSQNITKLSPCTVIVVK